MTGPSECQGRARRRLASESTPGESSPGDRFRRAGDDAALGEVCGDARAPRRRSVHPDQAHRGCVPLPQTPVSDFPRSPPPPSSSLAGSLRVWFSTSAPYTGHGVRVGPSVHRERPLAGCRLSRETGPVGLRVHWPWSPSLPAHGERLGPPFDGLLVLRDHPTPLVSWPSRLSFRDGYRLAAEAERSPRVSTQNFVPTPSPIRPPARRIWASLPLASSPAGWDASAALRFRSV